MGWKSVNCPSTLYPLPYAQPLVCFPEVRTEQGPGWVRLNTGSQPEKWKVFYPCLIYDCYSLYLFRVPVGPGKSQEAWGGVGLMSLSRQDEVVEGLGSASGVQQGVHHQSEQALRPHLRGFVALLPLFSL